MLTTETDGSVQGFSPANKRYFVAITYTTSHLVCDWFESDYRDIAVAVFNGLVERMRELREYRSVIEHHWKVRMWMNNGKHWRVTVDQGRIIDIEPVDSQPILGRVYDPEYAHD